MSTSTVPVSWMRSCSHGTSARVQVCARCGEEKVFEDFARNVRMPDGLQARCRGCVSAVDKAYRHRRGKVSEPTVARKV